MISDPLVHEFITRFREFRKVMENYFGSFRGEMYALQFIVKKGGGITPGEIVAELDVSAARIAATLNSLEKKNFITRQVDTSNRRKIIVNYTAEGKEFSEKRQQTVFVFCEEVLEKLGEEDTKEFLRIISRITKITKDLKKKKINESSQTKKQN